MVGWLVYGNILFFSDENDCQDDPLTQPMYNMMLFFIMLGYVQMVFTLLMICIMPLIVYIYLQSIGDPNNLSDEQISVVRRSL